MLTDRKPTNTQKRRKTMENTYYEEMESQYFAYLEALEILRKDMEENDD